MFTALIALILDCGSVLLIADICKASVNKSWYIHMTKYYLVITSDVVQEYLMTVLVKYISYIFEWL